MKNKNHPPTVPERLALLHCLLAMIRAVLDSRHVHLQFPAGRPLMVLAYVALKEEEGGAEHVTIGELKRALRISQAATSRSVSAHVSAGALEIMAARDARLTTVKLTRSGRAFIDEVLSAMWRQ